MPNADEEPTEVVGGFLKSPTEMVAAYFQPYASKMYAHLRIMVPSAEEEGEWVHTVKGVGIRLDQVPQLRDAVKQLLEVAAPNKVVATIPVGKDEIHVGTNTFKGEQYVFVRRFYKGDDGEWRPSPKGVNVHSERVSELVDLVEQLAKAAESFS
jgi:hypothetical protein